MSRTAECPVLVIADPDDREADLVTAALRARSVEFAWIDTADFPERLGLTFTAGTGNVAGLLHLPDGTILDLDTIEAVYRRSPGMFGLDDGMSAPERRFALMEAIQGFGGALASMQCRWMNHPARVADAAYKPYQLALAEECGLTPPRTVITNRRQVARDFVDTARGRVVYKPMSPGVVAESAKVQVINATILGPDQLDFSGIDQTAHMLQEFVEKRHDVRVTAVGVPGCRAAECVAVAIETTDEDAHVDWRANYDALTYRRIATPPAVQAGIARYLDRLDLRFAALDFSVDNDDSWWFLEANPNGMWAWIDEAAETGIADTIAQHLIAAPQLTVRIPT